MHEQSTFNRKATLAKQKKLLFEKRKRPDGLISFINYSMKVEKEMNSEAFNMKDIEETKQKYEFGAKTTTN